MDKRSHSRQIQSRFRFHYLDHNLFQYRNKLVGFFALKQTSLMKSSQILLLSLAKRLGPHAKRLLPRQI